MNCSGADIKFPVLIGGAAINRRFGRRILQTEDGELYESGVFYCKDAFEGLETMDQLIDPQRKPALLEKMLKETDMELGRTKPERDNDITGKRSNVIPARSNYPKNLVSSWSKRCH